MSRAARQGRRRRRFGEGVVLLWLLSTLASGAAVVAAAAPTTPVPVPASAPAPPSSPPPGAGIPTKAPVAPASPVPAPPAARPPLTNEPGSAQADLAAVAAPPEATVVVPRVVPTGDATAAESDHDAIAGAWGIEVRPVASTLPVFARRASTGCPATTTTATTTTTTTTNTTTTTDCPSVPVASLAVRHWLGRNLAVTGGLAFALGGGSEGSRLLDSYFGMGPVIGVSVLLANWRHLAIAASPELSFVLFKAAGSADFAYVTDLRAVLEAELHFGFIGVPALSLGIRSGLLFRLEHAADVTLWSVGVAGATSLKGLVSDLSLRYYF